MSRSVLLACLVCSLVWIAGCASETKKGPASIPVKGTVTLDGKPMPDGEISFETTGFPPVLLPVKDGAYSGEAKEGKNKVEIRVYKEGKPLSTDPTGPPVKQNILPERYASQSQMTADVAPGGKNEFTFPVTSK